MDKRVIVFEEIRPSHALWVRWYCWQGLDVYYLRVSSSVAQTAWFKKLTDGKIILKLTFVRPLYYGWNPAADRAYAVVESLYQEAFSRQSIVSDLERLYNSPDVHLAFRKVLTEELVDAFYCDLLRERLGETFPGHTLITLVPSEQGGAFRFDLWRPALEKLQAVSPTPIRFIFPRWLRFGSRLRVVAARIRTLAIYLYVGLALLRTRLTSWKGAVPDHSLRYAIAIYSPIREFANAIRGVGFLLDGNRIRKDNTIFVPLAPLNDVHRACLRQNGLRLAELPAAAGPATIGMYLAKFPAVLSSLLLQPEWLSRTYVGMLRTYALWKGFAERYPVSHFITYCDFGFRHIGRNILLGQAGVSTWFYVDTVNGPDNFPKPEDGLPYRQEIYGFLLYDHFVSWCERHARWNRMLHQKIGAYHDVGCLWSEHIRLIKEGDVLSSFSGRLGTAGYQPGMKVIAVFDSWFHDAGMSTSSDLLAFFADIERLSKEFKDLFFVVKEKRPRWFFRGPAFPRLESTKIYSVYEGLEKQPRFFFTGSNADSSEVIAFSDLVIAFPFTSVGLETLGARCRAIFYDSTDKHRNTYYAQIPGLVAHGYQELRATVQRLLYETSKEDYDRFLDTRVKGDPESFLDGMALTRFRRLLTERE